MWERSRRAAFNTRDGQPGRGGSARRASAGGGPGGGGGGCAAPGCAQSADLEPVPFLFRVAESDRSGWLTAPNGDRCRLGPVTARFAPLCRSHPYVWNTESSAFVPWGAAGAAGAIEHGVLPAADTDAHSPGAEPGHAAARAAPPERVWLCDAPGCGARTPAVRVPDFPFRLMRLVGLRGIDGSLFQREWRGSSGRMSGPLERVPDEWTEVGPGVFYAPDGDSLAPGTVVCGRHLFLWHEAESRPVALASLAPAGAAATTPTTPAFPTPRLARPDDTAAGA